LKTKSEYDSWSKTRRRNNVPVAPNVAYKDDWVSWYDFLGTEAPKVKALDLELAQERKRWYIQQETMRVGKKYFLEKLTQVAPHLVVKNLQGKGGASFVCRRRDDCTSDKWKPLFLRSLGGARVTQPSGGVTINRRPTLMDSIPTGLFVCQPAVDKVYLIPNEEPKLKGKGSTMHFSPSEQAKYELSDSELASQLEGELEKCSPKRFAEWAELTQRKSHTNHRKLLHQSVDRLYAALDMDISYSLESSFVNYLGTHRFSHQINRRSSLRNRSEWFSFAKQLGQNLHCARKFDECGDFFLCTMRNEEKLEGQFLFPKEAVRRYRNRKGVVVDSLHGIHTYPPWIEPGTVVSKHTKEWQSEYWFDLTEHRNDAENIARARQIFENAADLKISFVGDQ